MGTAPLTWELGRGRATFTAAARAFAARYADFDPQQRVDKMVRRAVELVEEG